MSDHPVEPPSNIRYVSRFDPHYFPYFDAPEPRQHFFKVMYDVSGKTRAENHLTVTAQDELLSCLLADARVLSRLDEWSTSIDLPQMVHDIADFLDRVAERYRFSHRADLLRIPRPPHISVEDFLPEWRALHDRLDATYRRCSDVLEVARRYVRDELQQPWPWLAYRLAFHLFEQAHDRALGVTPVRHRTSYLDEHVAGPLVQPFHFVFETTPDETIVEANRRFEVEVRNARKNLQVIQEPMSSWTLPRGSPRRDQQENVKQDARWLSRQLLSGEVAYDMAMSWHQERQTSGQHAQHFSAWCGCQQRVYRGLKKVTELLDKTPFVF